jgi:hypothetical protein
VDLLQKQIMVLTAKVDALYQMVEQLSSKISQSLAEGRLTPAVSPAAPQSYSNGDLGLEHKDILQDGAIGDGRSRSSEKAMAPEVQIQRLTAQLTAAYNQIAALEERLLAQRVR